ncbi:MAG: SPOR domain-containing protein, partial [Pseudomonadales bacterium]|nr:SPOR domain-containing protein [Pseudomonadales bacterium]
MLTTKLTAICLGLMLAQAVMAQTTYQVSVGSYKNQANAERAAAKAARELGDGYYVEPTQTANGNIYRVVSEPFLSRSAADLVSAKARQANISGAWVLTRDRPVAQASRKTTLTPKLPTVAKTATKTQADEPRSGIQALNGRKGIPVSFPAADITPSKEGALSIRRTDEAQTPFKIDGILDEPIWQEITVIDEFVTLEPDTLKKGIYETQVKIAYTDKGLYVAADMEQPRDTQIRRLSGRDVYFNLNRDSINLTLDTSGEGLYGFWFGINLGDSLMDGSVLPEKRFSNEWDGPWLGASQQYDERWTAEFFIPWSAIS